MPLRESVLQRLCWISADAKDGGGLVSGLWSVAQVLADHGYDDVEERRSDLLPGRTGWYLFDRYPRLTWSQDAARRRRAARAYDDLAADLAAGDWPLPTCPAEELALHLILEDAPSAAVEHRWAGLDEAAFDSLPEHSDDLDWDAMPDVLFQDTDILHLFEPGLDGIDDPHNAVNAEMAIGDYRPPAWFENFANMQPRDERRASAGRQRPGQAPGGLPHSQQRNPRLSSCRSSSVWLYSPRRIARKTQTIPASVTRLK